MDIQIQKLTLVFVCLSVLYCPSVHADDQSGVSKTQYSTVPLSNDDLREITAQVLAQEPLLSSSPGVKYADATQFDQAEISAIVIYYPHSESAGIKHAFQVECTSQAPEMAWECEDVKIRRYLALDTQDYEVRLTGPIEFNAAMALIKATGRAIRQSADDGVAVPDTVMMISSHENSATVSWTSFEGVPGVAMTANLSDDGDPTQPDSWVVTRLDR